MITSQGQGTAPPPMAEGVPLSAMNDDERLMMDKMRLLETDRKAFFESSQKQLHENREVIKGLQKESAELKAMLAASRRGATTIAGAETKQLDKEVFQATLRRDKLREEETQLRRQLEGIMQRMQDVDVNSQPLLTDDSPMARKIKQLESRLDKSLVKYNEAVSIRKTYDQIVKRLQEERVGFDNQLAAIERTLKAKEFDYQELLKMSHAANHAKEVAKRDLQKFKLAFDEERRAKDRQLAERKSYVQAKVDQTQRLERRERAKRAEETEAERQRAAAEAEDASRRNTQLQMANGGARGSFFDAAGAEREQQASQYEIAFRRIKEATGVSDVQEVLQRFLSQEETSRNLDGMAKEAQGRIAQLKTENGELAAKLEELRYSGSGQLGTRRIIEEFEVHLAEAANQTRSQTERADQLGRLLIDVKAGIEHLLDKLSTVRTDIPVPAMSDKTCVEALKIVDQKIASIAEEIVPTDLIPVEGGAAVLAETAPLRQPEHNVRVRVPRPDDDDGAEDEERTAAAMGDDAEDDTVLKRDQVKKISSNAVARELKKQRRKRKELM